MPEGRSENIQGNVPYRLAAACRPDMQPDPGTEPVSGRVERAEPSGRNTGRSQNLPCESRSVSAGKGPGAIVTDGRSEIKVACADGYVQIEELQIAGRRRMTTEELLRGFKEIESCTFR